VRRVDAGWTPALLVATVLAGGAFDGISAQTLVPERIGTVEVPLSQGGSIALMSDEKTACVIDSYEMQVRCVDRSGDVVGVFGREGEGPGEFGWLYRLVGGPNNTVGTVDNRLQRFSVFEPLGALVSEVALPGEALIMNPARRFSTTIAVVSTVTWDANMDQGGLALFEIDLASAEVVWTEVPPVDAEVECESVNYGFPDPKGGWVYVACESHMVFVAEDGRVSVLRAPTYTGELPHERDVAVMEEANRSTRRFGDLWGGLQHAAPRRDRVQLPRSSNGTQPDKDPRHVRGSRQHHEPEDHVAPGGRRGDRTDLSADRTPRTAGRLSLVRRAPRFATSGLECGRRLGLPVAQRCPYLGGKSLHGLPRCSPGTTGP